MTKKVELMRGEFNAEEEKYGEEWRVVLNTGGNYTLGKTQAVILQQAIATGNRGIIMFKTFSISIPYIAEFYRVKRFLKDAKLLPESASELEYKPIPDEKFKEFKKKAYKAIGRKYEE